MGVALRSDFEKAIYSASVMEIAIFVCRLLHHIIEQRAYSMAYPVRDLAVLGSFPTVGQCQFP